MDETFRTKGTVSKRISFPFTLWEEFERDCVQNFNDTYHLKIKHDHEFRKTFESTAALLADKVLQLEAEVEALRQEVAEKQPAQEQTTKRKTFE